MANSKEIKIGEVYEIIVGTFDCENDENNEYVRAEVVSLSAYDDDKYCKLEMIDFGGPVQIVRKTSLLKTQEKRLAIEKSDNSGTITNDLLSGIDIFVNDQALIKLCDNQTGKYIQYNKQIISIDEQTYNKVINNLVDNREFNTSPFDYYEDYFLSSLGFNVPKYK